VREGGLERIRYAVVRDDGEDGKECNLVSSQQKKKEEGYPR